MHSDKLWRTIRTHVSVQKWHLTHVTSTSVVYQATEVTFDFSMTSLSQKTLHKPHWLKLITISQGTKSPVRDGWKVPYSFGLNSQQSILPNLESMKSVKTEFWVCPSIMSNLLIQVSQCHSPPNFSVTAQEVAFSILYVHILICIIFICGRQWMMEFKWGLTFFARTFEEKFLIFQDKTSVTCEEVLSECVRLHGSWTAGDKQIPTFLANAAFVCDKSYVTASVFRVIISWICVYSAYMQVHATKECSEKKGASIQSTYLL